MTVDIEPVALKTEDGEWPSRGYLFHDKDILIKNVVVVAPASGAPSRFYFDFCKYLASHGHPTFVFSFRYVGDSYPPTVNLSSKESRIQALKSAAHVNIAVQWANDAKAACEFIYSRFPQYERVWIGHSNGGNVFTIIPTYYSSKFSRAIFVSCFNPSCAFMTFRASPRDPEPPTFLQATERIESILETCRELSYLPGPMLQVGEEMTLGVAEDWWGGMLRNDYLWKDYPQKISDYSVKTLILTFSDDDFLRSLEPVRLGMFPHLVHSRIRGLRVDPEKVGWEGCGHMNLFRKKGYEGREREGGPWEFVRVWVDKGEVLGIDAEMVVQSGPEDSIVLGRSKL